MTDTKFREQKANKEIQKRHSNPGNWGVQCAIKILCVAITEALPGRPRRERGPPTPVLVFGQARAYHLWRSCSQGLRPPGQWCSFTYWHPIPAPHSYPGPSREAVTEGFSRHFCWALFARRGKPSRHFFWLWVSTQYFSTPSPSHLLPPHPH